MKRCVLQYLIVCFSALILAIPANAAAQAPDIQTRFIGDVTLEQLMRGLYGSGTQLYMHKDDNSQNPLLVVLFSHLKGTTDAIAYVYDAPPGRDTVPVTIDGNRVIVDPTLQPTVTIRALGGWWVRDGLVNYNLDIQVNGPVASMWGANSVEVDQSSWLGLIKHGQPSVEIKVRDPQQAGLPGWELRTLLPEFPGRGYIRSNYAERTCATSISRDLGISPLWPFVASAGAFEQPVNRLFPPIVVDWRNGKITHFSELVTVRNQNCSYTLYSLNQIVPGTHNRLNFESPFAFYDLSGQGIGHPNLILRTEHFPVDDPMSTQIDTQSQQGTLAPSDFETIRYSWRNAIGDWDWDYKVEVMGFHPYTATTTIGDGLATVDAPSYQEFPKWVIDREWPVTTFIDTEGHSYQSSEGLYDWSPREVGVAYTFGWENERKPEAFTSIRVGLRGEYRSQRTLQPRLYLSPIDNRLHLLAAEGGLWSLSENQALRLQNLNGGDYIDSWVRLRVEPGQPVPSSSGEIEEQLAAFANYLVYSGADTVVLRPYPGPNALFTTLPPTDQTSWQNQRAALEPFARAKRDPRNLKSWLEVAPAGGGSLNGATISELRAAGDSFRFILNLQPGFQLQGDDLLGLAGRQPGSYTVSYDGAFHVEPLTPPAIRVDVPTLPVVPFQNNAVPVQLRNGGGTDVAAATLELWATPPQGEPTLAMTQTVALLAQVPITATLQWAPTLAGDWQLAARVVAPDGTLLAQQQLAASVPLPAAAGASRLLHASSLGATLPLIALLAIAFSLIAALSLRRYLPRPAATQVDDAT